MKNYRTLIFTIMLTTLFNTAFSNNIRVVLPARTAPNIAEPQQVNTISSIHRSLMNGQNTCADIINDYIYRIKRYDLALNRGAPLNAYVALNPLALQQAAELDNYTSTYNDLKGPLHCIPVIVNDNIDTINTNTTAGTLALLGSQPNQDALVVKQLKKAGAIILGKGSMDEFSNSNFGISSRSGRIGNVYNPSKNPGGSSSGAAVAVGADLAVIAIGTGNSGSILIPAAYNGIVGLRPSTDVINQQGIFPTKQLSSVVGPMARNVSDLAVTMNAITAKGAGETQSQIAASQIKYDRYLKKNFLTGKRIGLVRSVGAVQIYNPANRAANEIFQDTVQTLIELQATVVDIHLLGFDTNQDGNNAGEVEDINAYLSKFPSTRQNFSDICWSERLAIFRDADNCLDHMNSIPSKNSKKYQAALNKFSKNRSYVQNLMKEKHLDALLIPVNSKGGPSYDASQVNTLRAPLATNSGLPAINFIVGYTANSSPMPIAMEFIGKMYQESEIIGLVYAFEQNAPTRNIPALGNPRNTPLIKLSSSELNNLFTLLGSTSFKRNADAMRSDHLSAEDFANITKQVIKEGVFLP